MLPHFVDQFFADHPWASDIAGSLLGVFITATLFITGIVYERRRQRAFEARLYDDALYYFEQLLSKTVDWATQLARAYRNLSDGLRRAPLLLPEFAQYSDSAAQRLLEIDRQLLFKAFLHRYGRATTTIDLYVSVYDGLDYVMSQSDQADEARIGLIQNSQTLDAQFRKNLDSLLTQITTAGRLLADAPSIPAGLPGVLDEALLDLHRLTLPGTELEEAFQIVVQPLHRALNTRFATVREVQDVMLRTQKLHTLHANLLQQATESATRFALLGTALQLGSGTLRTAQQKMKAAANPKRGWRLTRHGIQQPDRPKTTE